MSIKCIVYEWSPNGCNDLLIVNGDTGEQLEYIDEALFGIDILQYDMSCPCSAIVPIDVVLRKVAVSPLGDGSRVVRTLSALGIKASVNSSE